MVLQPNPLMTGFDQGVNGRNPWNSLTPDDARGPLTLDPQGVALGQQFQAIKDQIAAEQAEAEARGQWTGGQVWEGGHPTGAGMLDAIGQVGTAVALGTGSGGDAPAPGFTAYHGSPHSFDQFDLSKIGTGEGAQAYGHGMYLADSEGVARNYRDALTPQNIPNPEFQALQREYNNADSASRDAMTKSDAEFNAALAARDAVRAKQAGVPAVIPNPVQQGHMYEVNVNADPDHFLDWDKPLSEQPQVATKLAQMPQFQGRIDPADDIITGQHILAELAQTHGGPAAASEALHAAGIPGIRYLDAGSRGAGDGTRNTVVFDANTMDIIRRYGLAGLMAGGGGAALSGQPGQQQ